MGERFGKRLLKKGKAEPQPKPVSELPSPFPEVLGKIGIQNLYPPQAEAVEHVLAGENVVLSIPTASGKSLVAYIGILHRFLKQRGKALYIVPLRALASEKFEELRQFRDTGLKVGIATGDLDQADQQLGKYDVVVCTSEKADSLLRHRSSWLGELSVVVADEVHLIHDGSRGPTLEVILARFRALNPDAQIIALSATIANARELAEWLDAKLVLSEWRPVILREGILFGNALEFMDGSTKEIAGGTKDSVGALVADIIRGGGQALVFCNTRKGAEAAAHKLGATVRALLAGDETKKLKDLAEAIDGHEAEASLTGARLSACVRLGTAFHNAGLSNQHRGLVEQHFKQGLLKVICATPTLAAGVNIPARRVVIRDVHRYESNLGNVPLPVMEVKQMMGRAGRPRYDPWGEAVLLAKTPEERDRLRTQYLEAGPEAITSKLGSESALRMHVLAAVATGFVSSRRGIDEFVASTFYAHQGNVADIGDKVDATLEFLLQGAFLESQDNGALAPTRFGRKTSDLYIDPLSALKLREALTVSKEKTPTNLGWLHAVCSTPDMVPLYLRRGDDWVDEKAAQHAGEVLLKPSPTDDYESFLAEFKTAWLLREWIDETPLETVEERFGIGPGDVHNRVQIGEWLLYAAKELAPLYNPDAARALSHLLLRVENGIKEDLLAVITLRGVGRYRARVLAANGYKTLDDLRHADPRALQRLPGFGPTLVANLKKQLGVDVEIARLAIADAKAHEKPGVDEFAEPTDGDAEVRLKRRAGQKSLLDWE